MAKFWGMLDPPPGQGDAAEIVEVPGRPYQTLQSDDSIRLLKLEPGSGQHISCSLVATRLADLSQKYEALSYVWGNSKDTNKLYMPNGTVSVTKNLCIALKQLRHSTEPRYIWADAACINQEDVAERGHQVTLMGSIYKSAEKVILWLGPDPKSIATMALSVIASVASGGQLNGQEIGQANFYSNGVSSANIPDLPCRDGPPKHSFKVLWGAVQELFNQGWFWRVWCIQEVSRPSIKHVYSSILTVNSGCARTQCRSRLGLNKHIVAISWDRRCSNSDGIPRHPSQVSYARCIQYLSHLQDIRVTKYKQRPAPIALFVSQAPGVDATVRSYGCQRSSLWSPGDTHYRRGFQQRGTFRSPGLHKVGFGGLSASCEQGHIVIRLFFPLFRPTRRRPE